MISVIIASLIILATLVAGVLLVVSSIKGIKF